jgi:large subunit ribosomal protein L29
MKSKEIRDLKDQEIEGRIKEETEQLDHLTFQHAIATLDNPMVLREKRRLVARLKTILAEKNASA